MKTKRTKIIKVTLAGVAALAVSGLLQSCATATPPARTAAGGKVKKTESIVCPQCKMVAVASYGVPFAAHPWVFSTAGSGWYPGWSSFAWGGLNYPQKTYEDKCPGCKGALTTLATEGKLQHKCSICTQKPFKCPVFHPDASYSG